MTRSEVLEKLLVHGPLSKTEMVVVTGWPFLIVDKALQEAIEERRVESRTYRVDKNSGVFRRYAATQTPASRAPDRARQRKAKQ